MMYMSTYASLCVCWRSASSQSLSMRQSCSPDDEGTETKLLPTPIGSMFTT